MTQAFQVGILRDLSPKDLSNDTAQHVPPISTAFRALPPLRRLLGLFIGMGVRPEHIAAWSRRRASARESPGTAMP
ncbi:hypothetical protein [Nonomuraea helvata]|uniref:Uncharacterized protein n=1 Tax=Nonomuraea helvata TaxID=37484 RepID=A0ABV5S714_9ACTN